MTEPTLPISPPSAEAVRSRLERAAGYLANVTEPGKTVLNALSGVREILFAACETGDLPGEFPDLVPRLSQLIADACPILAKDGAMSPERAYWGLGRTNDLLHPCKADAKTAGISYVAIFVGELSIAFHRTQLLAAGFEIFEDIFAKRLPIDTGSAALH
ncbi:hypothetical protein [Mesorhizobium sp. LSJC264A00]|uniref:hypothetical protein n=1 Tax=unclassified Mesorhizobium TaxID=325217 RepID=UPI0003CE4CE8|nr:hypothetical protein [Mesorhizobium sp. LSJC264A00]ESX23308.1 hypothetical protein X767_15950 [Mesorhizobium sp. LSJC264A00]